MKLALCAIDMRECERRTEQHRGMLCRILTLVHLRSASSSSSRAAARDERDVRAVSGPVVLPLMCAVMRETKVSMSIDASIAAWRSKIGRRKSCSSGERAAAKGEHEYLAIG